MAAMQFMDKMLFLEIVSELSMGSKSLSSGSTRQYLNTLRHREIAVPDLVPEGVNPFALVEQDAGQVMSVWS
jgi:hypothetical protein